MNIEEFVSEENHMCNLCGDLFYKIFDQEVIYDLPNNEFNRNHLLAQSVPCRKSERTFRLDL